VAYLDLSRAVRSVDSLLRQRQGIQEFTDDESCIFRISREPAMRALKLSDGTELREGDPILQLHLWNEHLPAMPASGPNTAWATLMKRRMHGSLAAVAQHIASHPELDDIKAVHGAPPFASRIGAAQMVRTGERFGFDVIDPDAAREWRDRIHLVFDSMLLWGLAYAFNPAVLKSKGLLRPRYQLWISRRKLLRLYRTPDRAERV
jgi:hypothetical protein